MRCKVLSTKDLDTKRAVDAPDEMLDDDDSYGDDERKENELIMAMRDQFSALWLPEPLGAVALNFGANMLLIDVGSAS